MNKTDKQNFWFILGGLLLGFGQLTRDNYGFVYGAGAQGQGANTVTVLFYAWGFWAIYKMIRIFIDSRKKPPVVDPANTKLDT